MRDNVEMPDLKKDAVVKKSIVVNRISATYVIGSNKLLVFLIILVIFFLLTVVLLFLFNKNSKAIYSINNVYIKDIEIVNYNYGSNIVDIAVIPSEKQIYCALSSKKDDSDNLVFQKVSDGKCYLSLELSTHYLYFKNDKNVVSKELVLDDYVVYLNFDSKQYVSVGSYNTIYKNIIVVGNPKINWITLGDIVTIKDNNLFYANKVGKTSIQGVIDNKVVVNFDVIVTDVIVPIPEAFDSSKDFLGCEVFSSDEAKLLDEILLNRIYSVGYGTRAGVVAAARFLTLEFPYRISYRWESGRLNNTGKHYVDGEGRYYHKGLYLDSSKYESIEASLFGPAMWGCKMISYEDDPPYFVPNRKYPNGLDCSGFVTWALLNGGFDVGDRGAGESPSKGQLTDLGELKLLNRSLINSGRIKVGDLFNFWGHIAILIGEDDNNYYIAESLNTYDGLIVKTYSKKTVMNTFKYVVLMDSVYLSDGTLTNMWY